MKDKTEIKIVTDDDESLKILGELLSNKTSRDLIKYLMDNSTYKNKISDELNMKFSLVEHHLKKLEKLGLVTITNKKLVKNGKLHKNYKINSDGIFVSFNSKEEVKEKGILKKIFREKIRISFSLMGIFFYFIFQEINLLQHFKSEVIVTSSKFAFTPIIISSLIIIIGFIVNYFIKKKN